MHISTLTLYSQRLSFNCQHSQNTVSVTDTDTVLFTVYAVCTDGTVLSLSISPAKNLASHLALFRKQSSVKQYEQNTQRYLIGVIRERVSIHCYMGCSYLGKSKLTFFYIKESTYWETKLITFINFKISPEHRGREKGPDGDIERAQTTLTTTHTPKSRKSIIGPL